MKTIRIECPSCKGTGLYKGMAEREGSAVVCYVCRGSGETTYSYNEFHGRKQRDDVTRVYQGSYGYAITDKDTVTNEGKEIKFSQYGCTYEEWLSGKTPEHIKDLYCPYLAFNKGMGNEPIDRCKTTCTGFGLITSCRAYEDKKKCWEIFDEKENKGEL